MMEQPTAQTPSLLDSYRVLDLTDEKAFLCGRLLADMGADVIKIERPGGDPSRAIGPFYKDIAGPEKSLYWFCYNANKRGITLNIESADGRELFKKLLKSTDFVVESFPAGHMASIGLGYADLARWKPDIIMASVTGFGSEGPFSSYKSSDMVAMAMGGWMYLCGEPERAPVVIGFPQNQMSAAADAAIGMLIAHHHRALTGEGQHVDVSMQEAVVMDTVAALPFWDINGVISLRPGPYRVGMTRAGVKQRNTWRCKDGYVIWYTIPGQGGVASTKAFVDWMRSENMADDFLLGIDWEKVDMTRVEQGFLEQVEERVARFFAGHTKSEIYREALKRRIILEPTSGADDLWADVQMRARDFWVDLPHPDLGRSIAYPGPFVKSSQAPLVYRRCAPLIGQHNREIYQDELGIPESDLAMYKQMGVI